MRMLPIPIEGLPGESIFCAAERVIARANDSGNSYLLTFNETNVNVYPGSHRFDVAEKWAMSRVINDLKGEK